MSEQTGFYFCDSTMVRREARRCTKIKLRIVAKLLFGANADNSSC